MDGDDRVRHCSLCRQAVYDVSALTRAEAETLIRGRTGRVCLRLFRRADGRVMTRDCPVGVLQAARRRLAKAVGACTFLVVLLFGWVASRPGATRAARDQVRSIEEWINPRPQCVMGEPLPMPGTAPVVEEDDEE
jgi:hypothetical protein